MEFLDWLNNNIFDVSVLRQYADLIGLYIGLPIAVIVIIGLIIHDLSKKNDKPRFRDWKQLFLIPFRNLWTILTTDLKETQKGLDGPPGLTGMMGPPADYMYLEWLKTNPGKTIDDFIQWFVSELEWELKLSTMSPSQREAMKKGIDAMKGKD